MTTYFPALAFVASPDPAAAVLLDLNGDVAGASVRALHEGFSLGMASLGGDAGDRARAWGIREGVTVPLLVEGPRAAARAALRLLAQQATRDGWLRTQLDATSPVVWFRVYASAPEALDWDLIFNDRATDRWQTSLPLSVESFGIGETVTLPAVVVRNNPADASFAVTLPEIQGEMPAPALVKVVSSARMLGPAVAVSRETPQVLTGTGWWSSTTATADATYVGGTRHQTSAAFDQWTHLVSFGRTAGEQGGFRGLVRLDATTNVGAFQLRWKVFGAGAVDQAIYTPPVTVPCVSMARWVDVGRIPWPIADGAGLGASLATNIQLQGRRVAPGGELLLDDRLVMVPANEGETLLRTQIPDMGTDPYSALVDAEDRAVVASVAGQSARQADFAGQWPTLTPGVENRLTVLQNLDPTLIADRDDVITSVATVTVSYRPRYLWGI